MPSFGAEGLAVGFVVGLAARSATNAAGSDVVGEKKKGQKEGERRRKEEEKKERKKGLLDRRTRAHSTHSTHGTQELRAACFVSIHARARSFSPGLIRSTSHPTSLASPLPPSPSPPLSRAHALTALSSISPTQLGSGAREEAGEQHWRVCPGPHQGHWGRD